MIVRTTYFLRSLVVCLSLATFAPSMLCGQQQQASEAPAAFQLPADRTAEAMHQYLERMLTFNPQTPEQAEQYQKFAPDAMTTAAQNVLRLEQDTNSDRFRFAQKYLLALDVMAVDQATPDEKQQLLDIIKKNLSHPKMDADDLDIAVAFAEGLEMTGDAAMAGTAYQEFASLLQGSKDPLVNELGQLMEGSSRRLNLLGNSMQVNGTTLQGQPFNWSAYRGKTVLVDFWASWCGPCRAEMPQIKNYYQAYRNRGFEVVAISLDEDRAKLDEFLAATQIPWVTLFEPDGKTNPTATRYGITSLPTSVLIDKSGRVVSLNARGEQLGKLLTQLLGPPK